MSIISHTIAQGVLMAVFFALYVLTDWPFFLVNVGFAAGALVFALLFNSLTTAAYD